MKSRPISPKVDVRCNACGENIVLDTGKLKSHHFPDGIHMDYFACEHCQAKYVSLVTDAELRKDIKRRGFKHSAPHMKTRALELKQQYADRIKDLP